MNSISGNLNAASIAATARMLRSAKKEVILIVEGDDDIALFSNSLSLPKSNFISCFGKKRLMEVFALVPHSGLDAGTILLRDSDCDGVQDQRRGDVLLLTSDFYDFEMSLLPKACVRPHTLGVPEAQGEPGACRRVLRPHSSFGVTHWGAAHAIS